MTWTFKGPLTVEEPLPQGGGSFGSRAIHNNRTQRRGEAPVAGRPPKPPKMGFDSLHPCECEDAICLNGLGSSRLNSSLTTEEIASNGIGSRVCHVAAAYADPTRGLPSWDGTWP